MSRLFRAADILLPKTEHPETWAVIACDQHTSEPDYWKKAEELCTEAYSSLDMIVPEAWLNDQAGARIRRVQEAMEHAYDSGWFKEYQDAYIYVERTLLDGRIRRGLVGCVDLEQYDYHDHAETMIRATEKTVAERIPPRRAVRQNALLELPHVILLMDDDTVGVMDRITAMRDSLPLLYDFELMLGGGRLRGWLIEKENAEAVTASMDEYIECQKKKFPDCAPLCFASGDGNHSLASAKAAYLQKKKKDPSVGKEGSTERYTLVELEDLQDPVQVFEPIHRVLFDINTDTLMHSLRHLTKEEGMPFRLVIGEQEYTMYLDTEPYGYQLGVLQPFLDAYCSTYGGRMDYIHGEEAVRQLAKQPNTAGFLLEPLSKDGFFRNIAQSGVYPRKTFSIGEAEEKRYYMEARRIKKR